MIRPSQLARLVKIARILLRFGLNRRVIKKSSRKLRALTYLNPWSYCDSPTTRGESLCVMLEKLGPVFIKFGQMLSTRRDVLPEDIADSLAKLQDSVAAFPAEQALAIIERELDKSITEVFSHIEETPMAAASIAQVHAATTLAGDDVVIKVLRPNIYKIIRKDLSVMYLCARLVQRFWKRTKSMSLVGLTKEFEHTIIGELDLLREAANASQLRRNFEGDKKLYIPAVHWAHCTKRIMVMERIYGVRISNVDELKAKGTDLQKLAEHGIEIFFTQVLRDSFFHADMHPGNLFVDVRDPKNPVYLGVDFGIMGTLGTDDQFYLAKNLLAFFRRDYRRVAKLHVECGWVPSDTRVDLFESAIRAVSEPIFQRPLGDISFAQLLLRLFQTAEKFHMKLQPQLLLLQKTLLNIEGLGRQLYPELDLWATAHPFLEKWLKEKHSLLAIGKQAISDFPTVFEKALATPELFHDTLKSFMGAAQTPYTKSHPTQQPPARTARGWLGLGLGLLAGIALTVFNPIAHAIGIGVGLGIAFIAVAACTPRA